MYRIEVQLCEQLSVDFTDFVLQFRRWLQKKYLNSVYNAVRMKLFHEP